MNQFELVAQFAQLRPAATFLSLRNYTNASGEVSDYQIVFHMSYHNALKRSLEILDGYQPENELEKQAAEQLRASWLKSLEQTEPKEDGYARFQDGEGNEVKGVKLNINSGNLHIYGLLHSKQVKTPGVYKEKKSSELTKTKDKLTRLTPLSKFRQFIISPDKVKSISVEKLNIEI